MPDIHGANGCSPKSVQLFSGSFVNSHQPRLSDEKGDCGENKVKQRLYTDLPAFTLRVRKTPKNCSYEIVSRLCCQTSSQMGFLTFNL